MADHKLEIPLDVNTLDMTLLFVLEATEWQSEELITFRWREESSTYTVIVGDEPPESVHIQAVNVDPFLAFAFMMNHLEEIIDDRNMERKPKDG